VEAIITPRYGAVIGSVRSIIASAGYSDPDRTGRRIVLSVSATPVDLYSAAFSARWGPTQTRGRMTVDEAGLRGVMPGAEDPQARLLVTDDHAHDVLAALLPYARTGMIRVFETAARCVHLVADQLGWGTDTVTAMVCRDLDALPVLALPDDLALRSVRRLAGDSGDGVALTDAVAAASSADPALKDAPDVLAEFLLTLPSTFHLLAAVDSGGTARATSGFGVFGRYATVIFVNTDRDWRGRGIGQAMSAHALRAAQRAGARQASLDASEAGRSIYLRLGFEIAGSVTRFVSPT
jgi:GNAT superfamily N-acetyltransferase